MRYKGEGGNYGSDIAILILKTELEFGNFVHPVCLDLSNNIDLTPGLLGKVNNNISLKFQSMFNFKLMVIKIIIKNL